MENLKLFFFKKYREEYIINNLLKEYNKNKNKNSDEEYLYYILFKKLNINKKIK